MKNYLSFILIYPFIWLFSKLPFRVLYFISDCLYILVYHIVGYRKKIVFENLSIVFPTKLTVEKTKIAKAFYHHFVDILMEMLKSFSITEKEINDHYKYSNIEVLNDLYKDGKSAILVGGHYANWEWILNICSFTSYKPIAAYTKINNPYFEKAMLKSRGKFGVQLRQTSQTISEIEYNQKNNIQAIYGLLSDQSPRLKRTYYWNKFFGVKVPIHTGSEMLAKKYNMNVVFMDTKKIKRGYYETSFTVLTNDARKYKDYDLTDEFLEMVEKQVRKKPEYYFWTHKRFKHRDKAPKD